MSGEIDINDAKEKPELQEKTRKGLAAASKTAATDAEAVKMTDGEQRSIEEVVEKSKNDLAKVKKIINQGGFTGPDKDKYTISLHHAEWVYARNLYRQCDFNIMDKSTKYTNLVKKKANKNDIVKAHQEWVDMRNKCRSSSNELIEKADQYIETDRRVRENKKAEGDMYPDIGGKLEPFQVQRNGYTNQLVEGFTGGSQGRSITEGFDFAELESTPGANLNSKFNARIPLYSDSGTGRATATDKKTLPWNEYYRDCDALGEGATSAQRTQCKIANSTINTYIQKINSEFDRADWLLNAYYTIITKGDNQSKLTLLEERDIQSILDTQKKNINLYKQNALYDYEEYNSLAFYEDLAHFLYYAVFIIFAVLSLRTLFTGGNIEYRLIGIVVVLGIYPKYILQVVLWIVELIEKILEMLGLKNVRFWH
jgi:hypothetical protein